MKENETAYKKYRATKVKQYSQDQRPLIRNNYLGNFMT